MSETIKDVVKSLREWAEARRESSKLLRVDDKMFDLLADRIETTYKREREAGAEAAQIIGYIGEMVGREAACEQTVTNCNQLGNAAAMREALLRILGTADHLQTRFSIPKLASEEILELKQIAESALSAPPRNCDRYSHNGALVAIHNDRCYVQNPVEERKFTVDWLYAEAKGE